MGADHVKDDAEHRKKLLQPDDEAFQYRMTDKKLSDAGQKTITARPPPYIS
jgi:hypothetical protein